VDPVGALRTGRRLRRRKEHRTRRFPDMVMIQNRPADAIDRLVQGIGKSTKSLKKEAALPSALWSNGPSTSSSSYSWRVTAELRICAID
jgi:hypothetical protein